MASEGLLIALGGNALILSGEKGYIEDQFIHTDECMKPVAALIAAGIDVVITHGNGPIVGNILLRNECARNYIPPMPLYICVADSQGGIGAMMAQSLRNELKSFRIEKTVSTIITHVVVEADDPAFKEPTKPIGPYYKDDDAARLMREGWKMRKISGRGLRRLVPSPEPKGIVEIEAIRAAFRSGIVAIASGGGGIPVIEEEGRLKGIDAVIDKDLSASLLASELSLKKFVILTDVDGVYLNWESDKKEKLAGMTVNEAKKYLFEGQFPPGSMGPKIEAAIRFLEAAGKEVIISNPRNLMSAMEGREGTKIIP